MPRLCSVRLILVLVVFLFPVLSGSALEAQRLQQPTDQTIGLDLVDEVAAPAPRPERLDPPGVLNSHDLTAVTDLAAKLSEQRSWLTPEVLATLDERAVGLDEVFDRAPRFVSVDDALYRIKLEKVGELWDGFAGQDAPFVVFLTHEVYDGLGDDRALAYQDGEEMILYASDFEKTPAIALTFFKATQDEWVAPDVLAAAPSALEAIPLGEPRPEIVFHPHVSIPPLMPTTSAVRNLAADSHCAPEVAPTSCSGTTIRCPVDYNPYFIVSGLRVFENHEGCCFHGDPEIEIYPLPVDSMSGVGGVNNATTPFVFSGRTIVDMAGRTRFLPDVDDGGSLYSMNVALIPSNSTSQFVALMVEDDDDPGRLVVDNELNVGQLLDAGMVIINISRNMNRFFLFELFGALLDLIGVLPNNDDLFQPSLGATNNLFCTNGLGGSFPRNFTMSSSEWELRGYFACVNPTCEDSGGGSGGGGGGDPTGCGLLICPEDPGSS